MILQEISKRPLQAAEEGRGDFRPNERGGDAEQDGEEHEMKHVRRVGLFFFTGPDAGDGSDGIRGDEGLDDLHQGGVGRGGFLGGVGDAFGGIAAVAGFEAVARFGIDAFAGADGVGEGEADDDGDGRDDQGVAEGFQADAAELADVADAGDADDERREDERNDDHQKKAEEEGADRFGDIRDDPDDARIVAAEQDVGEDAGGDADAETDQDAGVEREALGTIRGLVVEVGGGFALEVVGRARFGLLGSSMRKRRYSYVWGARAASPQFPAGLGSASSCS